MNSEQRAQLEERGYYETTVAEWLGLTQAASDHAEIVLAVSTLLKCVRERAGLSTRTAARRVGMTEARYKRVELGIEDPPIELAITAALKLGAHAQEIGRTIAHLPVQPSTAAEDRTDSTPAQPQRRARARAA